MGGIKNMSKFQLIFTGVFAAFIVIGVLVFSLSRNENSANTSPVTVWGFLPQAQFNQILKVTGLDKDEILKITYVEKRADSFDSEFVTALADGKGPDLFFVSQASLLAQESRIFPIPFKTLPERDYKDSFIEGSEVFLSPQGVLAMPFIVDPLVMYWNRTLFTNAGLAREPHFWEEVYSLTNRLTKKDEALNITQSTVPFGEFRNVTNAKAIISLLTLQAGNPMSQRTATGLNITLSEKFNFSLAPMPEALRFYTDFSNPSTIYYSWNRSLPASQNFFTAGDVALYFGFASELPLIQQKNPNLNFDVAGVPQSRQAKQQTVYANFYGLAISKNAKNIAGAFAVATRLTDVNGIQALVNTLKLPPVRRDLISQNPTDPFMTVFYDSALRSKTWIEPGANQTSQVFQSMIESITSGRSSIVEAVSRADGELQALIKR